MDSHGGSIGHRKCMDAYNAKTNPQETPMNKLCRKFSAKIQDKLVCLFNIAHSVAVHNWSLNDFKALCELQSKNGVDMGQNYQNIQGASAFIKSIAEVQRQDTMRSLRKARFFSIMADGSTDRSIAEQESVYVR